MTTSAVIYEMGADIGQMRQSGATLRQIASHFGICPDKVRRVLLERDGTTEIQGLVTVVELSRLTSCSRDYIIKLKRLGVIHPERIQRINRLWKPETIATILLYKDRHPQRHLRCRVCDEPLPARHWEFCSEACRIEGHKYKNSSDEAKRRHSQFVRRWTQEHPQQAKQLQQQAQRRYKKRQAYEATPESTGLLISLSAAQSGTRP